MCEREPVLSAMLRSALEAAEGSGDPWLSTVAHRMTLFHCDARDLDPGILADLDVISLDPMFPRTGKSAAAKKEMALFRKLFLRGGGDEGELLAWALDRPVARVVVKRPPRAEYLGGCVPSHQLPGKAVRYDVYTRGPWR